MIIGYFCCGSLPPEIGKCKCGNIASGNAWHFAKKRHQLRTPCQYCKVRHNRLFRPPQLSFALLRRRHLRREKNGVAASPFQSSCKPVAGAIYFQSGRDCDYGLGAKTRSGVKNLSKSCFIEWRRKSFQIQFQAQNPPQNL